MNARVLAACFVIVVAVDATAADIYKCTEAGATTYQSTPCGSGQVEKPIRVATQWVQGGRNVQAAVPAQAMALKRGPWTRTSIEVGMSDDEVLNMPGWGRPTQISRARLPRGWEEVWRYGSVYGARELRFVNARLADVVEGPAPLAQAR